MNRDLQQPRDKWALSFVGPIEHPWTQCLRNKLADAASNGVQELTLLFSSYGGSLFEGFALYNLIRSMPYEVNIHNIGSVQSIANIVFLAGRRRTAARHSSFMMHNFTWTFASETLTDPQIHEKVKRQFFEVPSFISPPEAESLEIIEKIEDLKLPTGMPVANVVQGQ